MAEVLRTRLRPAGAILDAECGTGLTGKALAYDGLECIGVLTYLPDSAEMFRDFGDRIMVHYITCTVK